MLLCNRKKAKKKWKNAKTRPGEKKNVEHEGMRRPRTTYPTLNYNKENRNSVGYCSAGIFEDTEEGAGETFELTFCLTMSSDNHQTSGVNIQMHVISNLLQTRKRTDAKSLTWL